MNVRALPHCLHSSSVEAGQPEPGLGSVTGASGPGLALALLLNLHEDGHGKLRGRGRCGAQRRKAVSVASLLRDAAGVWLQVPVGKGPGTASRSSQGWRGRSCRILTRTA